MAALTKNLADELAPHGIQAMCVHPGLIRTEATPGVIAAQAKAQGLPEAEIEGRMNGRNLVKKLITAEQIAYVVAFLASPKAIAINGDAIPAGGETTRFDLLLIVTKRPAEGASARGPYTRRSRVTRLRAYAPPGRSEP